MSDQLLARLERQAAMEQTPASRGRVLTERVRVGLLTQERLELAAYCGNEPAVIALGRCACGCGWSNDTRTAFDLPLNHAPTRNFDLFVHAMLERWPDDMVAAQASLAASRVAVGECQRRIAEACLEDVALPDMHKTTDVILAAETWIACPCMEHKLDWDMLLAEALNAFCPRIGDGGAVIVRSYEFGPEQAVREAVCLAVAGWALSGTP